jgi:hypothetical protein
MAKNKPTLHQPIPELEAALAMPIRCGTTVRAAKNQDTRFSYSKAFSKLFHIINQNVLMTWEQTKDHAACTLWRPGGPMEISRLRQPSGFGKNV